MPDLLPIRRALFSVSDKDGLVPLAAALHQHGAILTASGGTAEALRDANLPTEEVSDITGFPELMDGRLKTLHPRIHGGLLADRSNPDHLAAMEAHGIPPIDLLAVNLYPFAETLARTSDEAALIEKIDIGGPAMLRAAAKNHAHVCVLSDPADYAPFLESFSHHNGATPLALRRRFAAAAFRRTAHYDTAITDWLLAAEAPVSPTRAKGSAALQ